MCFHFYITSLLPASSAYPRFSEHVEIDKENELMLNKAAGGNELPDS